VLGFVGKPLEADLRRRRQRAAIVIRRELRTDAQHHHVIDDADALVPIGDQIHLADEVLQRAGGELTRFRVRFRRLEQRLERLDILANRIGPALEELDVCHGSVSLPGPYRQPARRYNPQQPL